MCTLCERILPFSREKDLAGIRGLTPTFDISTLPFGGGGRIQTLATDI